MNTNGIPLKTKQERFAYNVVVKRMKIPDAYSDAGYKSKDRHNSYKTLKTDKVKAIIEQLQKELREEMKMISKDRLCDLWIDQINDDNLPASLKQKAMIELGKLIGFYETRIDLNTSTQTPLFILQPPQDTQDTKDNT